MNRAFLIILAPALLVALVYLAAGWGWRVSLPVGIGALALGGVLLFFARRARHASGARSGAGNQKET